MNASPYQNEEERREARRRSWRDSKERRKAKTPKERRQEVEKLLDQILAAKAGPPERRAMILEILARHPEAYIRVNP